MFSKMNKWNTSIWIGNNRKKITLLKFLITVSLPLCFICEAQCDNEGRRRASVHMQFRLASPAHQSQSQDAGTALQRGGGRHWPPHPESVVSQSIMWVSKWSSLTHPQFRYQANRGMTTWRPTICNLGWQPGKGSWPPHPH